MKNEDMILEYHGEGLARDRHGRVSSSMKRAELIYEGEAAHKRQIQKYIQGKRPGSSEDGEGVEEKANGVFVCQNEIKMKFGRQKGTSWE